MSDLIQNIIKELDNVRASMGSPVGSCADKLRAFWTPERAAFMEAARKHGWYETAFADEADGMGLQECQEADAAKSDFLASYRALVKKGG